jgi:nucleoside-specific outer membrane channel protein Tsx
MTGDVNLAGFGEAPSWNEVGVDRWQVGAGWFMTNNILVKGEYVTQSYNDYPTGAAETNAEFDGLMIEGVISF